MGGSEESESLLICEDPSNHIDVLLTDVVMPYMRGDVLAERLQKLRPELHVLFMSGYAGEHPEFADRLILKPFEPDELARRLRQLIDGPGADADGSLVSAASP